IHSGAVEARRLSSACAITEVRRSSSLAGTLRALAVSSIDRSSALPDVPTVAETAVPGFNAVSWHGLVAPQGTPPEIVDALYKASSSALKSEEVRKRLDQEGARAQGDAPAEFGAFIKEQIATWRGAVEASGATAE
ncbi:MAG: Bug family tripartite tricarboxylate transporter substrate binding protein, partial [Pollutimonas bauzanensis]